MNSILYANRIYRLWQKLFVKRPSARLNRTNIMLRMDFMCINHLTFQFE